MKILILSVLLFLSGWIQAAHPVFSRITTDHGLSSAQVSSILQDRKGYLWVGTAEGLNRYDGDSFVVYRPDPQDPNSIQGSYIDQLFEDATGAIWIFFTSGEISMYDPDTELFSNYSKEWLQQQFRMYGKPTCFSASVPGRAFIGTENGLLMYTYSSGKLTHVRNTASIVSSTLINCLYMSPDGLLWIGTLSGYSAYNPRKDTFTDYTLQTEGIASAGSDNLNGVHCIYEDSSGGLWVGTGKRGAFRAPATVGERLFYPVGQADTRVYQFLETRGGDIWFGHSQGATLIRERNRESLRCEYFFNSPEDLAPSGECHVKTLLEDKNGFVWFTDSRFNRGQSYYDSHTAQVHVLLHSAENPYSISSNQITCLYRDRSDNLWIGHANYGLSRCDLNLPVFTYTFGYAGDNGSLSSSHVVAVYEDRYSNLWIGTTQGLDRLNPATSQIDKRFRFSATGGETALSGQIIGSLAEDREGYLWVSYLDAPPDRLDLTSCRKRPLQMNYRQEYEATMRNPAKLCADSAGYVWLTTGNGGVAKCEVRSHKTYFYTHPSLPVKERKDSHTGLLSLCLAPGQHIWIGTDGEGLRRLDGIADTFTNYRHAADRPGSIASDHIRYLFCDASGGLWIGTNAGLDRYRAATDDFEHFTVQEGLAGNVIQGIQEAEPGILYISTSRGISRLDTHTRQIINYSTANGLLSNEFIAGACCKRKSGEIVFGSNRGIVSFDPARIQEGKRKIAHSPLISDVYLSDKRLKTVPLSLPFEELKDLKIQFLSFNYAYPGNNRYRYKLEPYDSDWKPTDSGHRYASYNELPAGSYTFLVEASEDGIVWSEPTALPIRILPPWWRTGWFITLVATGIAALLYLLYKSRIHWYKVRQAELEQKVHDRTMLLKEANHKLQQLDEQKTRFFTNVSHELRTPLTIINGLTESLEQQADLPCDGKRRDTLHTIRRNTTRLIRHVNELLDVSLPDKGIPPAPAASLRDLHLFLRELAASFVPVAEKYHLSLTYSISPDIQLAGYDPEALEQVVYNLISNAFKYTPDGGCVRFTATAAEQALSAFRLVLKIQDTGIGISPESLPHLFDRYYQDSGKTFQRSASSGIGLASVKETVERLQGTLTCESQVGEGSLFTCSIPMAAADYPTGWLPDSVLSLPPEPLPGIHTLLFIEDNEDLCRYLSDSFSADYQIYLAENGEEGFRMAAEIQPDAIVSDVMMPVMDGISCCKKLKTDERTAHIPVILLTALSEEKRQLDGYGAGADDYLAKPFSIHILKAKIRNLISRKEQLQAYFKDSFHLHTPDAHIPDPEKAFVLKATQVVLDNLQNPQFDVELFCSEMAMSRANLFRKLKAATGFSASSFTRNIRIKRAAELLQQRTHTINEISTQVGFSDPNYFSRCFKEIYGVTPSNY